MKRVVAIPSETTPISEVTPHKYYGFKLHGNVGFVLRKEYNSNSYHAVVFNNLTRHNELYTASSHDLGITIQKLLNMTAIVNEFDDAVEMFKWLCSK